MFSEEDKIALNQRYSSPCEELLNKFFNHLLKINKLDGKFLKRTIHFIVKYCMLQFKNSNLTLPLFPLKRHCWIFSLTEPPLHVVILNFYSNNLRQFLFYFITISIEKFKKSQSINTI
jgi:hypothetical protein